MNIDVTDASADSSAVSFSGYTSGAFREEANQGQFDGFVYTLDSSGNTLWVRHQGSSDQDATNAVLRRSGQVYAAGDTVGVLGPHNNGSVDAFLRRLRGGDGTTVWTDQ